MRRAGKRTPAICYLTRLNPSSINGNMRDVFDSALLICFQPFVTLLVASVRDGNAFTGGREKELRERDESVDRADYSFLERDYKDGRLSNVSARNEYKRGH